MPDNPNRRIRELGGHASWARWHKDILIELDTLGLRHLLSAHLEPMSEAELHAYVLDQQRAVRLLVRSLSTRVLQRLFARGWEAAGATLQATLALLADMLAEPERHPQQGYAEHRNMADLGRITMGPNPNGMRQYLLDAQACYDGLLARYGHGQGSVEELLEHLFTSSVMEGLKGVRAREYGEWMQNLSRGQEFGFLEGLVRLARTPRAAAEPNGIVDDIKEELDDEPGIPRGVGMWSGRRGRRSNYRGRARGRGWRGRGYRRYPEREGPYPDCYRPNGGRRRRDFGASGWE